MRTTIVSEQPDVFVIAPDSVHRSSLLSILSTQDVTLHTFSEEELIDQAYKLQQAYRVIWLNTHTTVTPALQKITSALEQASSLDVIQPLLSPLETDQGSVFTVWENYARQQQVVLEHCNAVLTHARFFIIRDCVDITSHSPLIHMVQRLSEAVVLYPDIEIAPQTFDDALQGIIQKLFDPRARRSISVHGNRHEGVEVAQELANQYESYHSITLNCQVEHVRALPLLPFRCDEVVLPVDLSDTVARFSRALPSPNAWDSVPQVSPLPTPKTQNFEEGADQQSLKPINQVPALNRNTPASIVPKAPSRLARFTGRKQRTQQLQGQTQPQFRDDTQETITQQQKETENKIPEQDFNLSDEVHRLFASSHLKKKQVRKQVVTQQTKKITKKTRKNTVLFYGGMFFTGIGLGVLALLGVFYVTLNSLESTLTEVVTQITSDEAVSESQWQSLGRKERIVAVQAESYGALFSTPWISEAESFLKAGDLLREYEETRFKANESLNLLVSQFLGTGAGDTALLAQNVGLNAQKQYDLLSELESQLQVLPINEEVDSFQESIDSFAADLESKRKFLLIQQQLESILPTLSGETSRRRYAVLLQNNQELRPTGGFLQAIALVTYENGTLVSVQVYRTSEIDQKIQGSVVPPADITRLLGEDKWFVSDANWDPHFPATAEQIRWFLEKTLNVQVDGVIGLDLFSLARILEAIGPVDVPEYNETVTHKNLQERMEFHSEVVLVDGIGKREYPEVLFEKILQHLQTVSGDDVPALLSALSYGLTHQHFMVSFFDDAEQSIFKSVGWTGGLLEPQCPTQLASESCVVDTIAQVDANVGINKANYYIDRVVEHTVSLSEDGADHIRRIEYRNSAESNAWPKGSYKAYSRFYLSKNSVFKSIILDGEEISPSKLFLGTEHGRTVVGVSFEIPIQSMSTLEVRYATPFEASETFSYALFNQKQPGTQDTATSVFFTYDDGFTPTLIAPQALLLQDTIVFTEEAGKHGFFGTKFATEKTE